MVKLLSGLEGVCLPYLGDMAIFSDDWEDHLKHLKTVLIRVKEAKLKIKIAKCKFAQKNIRYLGHVVGEDQCKRAQAKIRAITELPTPKK